MFKLSLLMAVIFIYALWGVPTPDDLGIIEIIVGLGLLAVIGAAGLAHAVGLYQKPDADSAVSLKSFGWEQAARCLFVWGMTIPLLVGLFKGHPLTFIFRDLIPFLFLLLPLFAPPSLYQEARARSLLLYALCFAGLVFVLRVAGEFWWGQQYELIPLGFVPDPKNLVNAPTVLLAALFLTGAAGSALIRAARPPQLIAPIFLFLLVFVLLGGMAAIGQRAHIGAWVLAVVLWLVILALKEPLKLRRPVLAVVVLLLCLWPFAMDVAAGLMQKTTMVGVNNRWEEAAAVWNSFAAQPWAFLIGQGWGSSFVSPAVGPYPVTYTHSLPTYYIMKTGVVGFSLCGLYLALIGAGLWRLFWRYPVVALPLAAPFLIDIFLYASFKTLDFGLLLLLISLWTTRLSLPLESCQNGSGWCMQEDNP